MKAFPIAFADAEQFNFNTGMDLRDYFAAKAMHALLMHRGLTTETLSKEAYRQADAMLKAREQ